MRWLIAIALAACGTPAHVESVPRPVHVVADPPIADKLEAAITGAVAKAPLLGISVRIMRGDQVVFAKGFGFADVAKTQPITPDTVFAIGSLTKQFTAAAVLQLVEAGKLLLDEPIATYVPQLVGPITVQQLLWQTAGLRENVLAEVGKRGDEAIAAIVALGTEFPAGTRWAYNNSNYFVLGRAIEKASGQPYADYLRDHVFSAAGLTSTTVCTSNRPGAQPAVVHGGELVAGFQLETSFSDAAGAICSTTADLMRWQAALFGGKVVSAASLAVMTDNGALASGKRTHYGAGLITDAVSRHRRIWHNGALSFGYQSQLAYYPDDNLRVAILANTYGKHMIVGKLEPQLSRIALGVAPARADEGAAELIGHYRAGKISLEIKLDDGELHLLVGDEDHTLAGAGNDVFELDGSSALSCHVLRDHARVTGIELYADDKLVLSLPRID